MGAGSSTPAATYRLLLVGCTGTGKSSLGNAILGKDLFKARASMKAQTSKCELQKERRGNTSLEVVDTPGFCDQKRTDDEINDLITRFLAATSPGPHAVLVIVKASERYHTDLTTAYTECKKLLGEQKLADRIILVFTGKDLLSADDMKNFDENLDTIHPNLKEMVKDADRRYILFDNKAKGKDNDRQLEALLELVRKKLPLESYLSAPIMERINETISNEAEKLSKEKKISLESALFEIRKEITEATKADGRLSAAVMHVTQEIKNQTLVIRVCAVM